MYLTLYDENQDHITNLINITTSLTQRAYDKNNFSASGAIAIDWNDEEIDLNPSKICVMNDDNDNQQYACFVDTVTVDDGKATIKGIDFKTLLDTMSYFTITSTDLASIIDVATNSVVNSSDTAIQKVTFEYEIDDSVANIDTSVFGDFSGIEKVENVRSFLLPYMKYYNVLEEYIYDEVQKKITLRFWINDKTQDITLEDFDFEKTTSAMTVNKAVAGIAITDDDDVTTYVMSKYYYITNGNDVVDSDTDTYTSDRIYPVKTSYFTAEYLADAQYAAISELANQRYVDNINLNANDVYPLDLATLDLATMINIYTKGEFYKTLPVAEKKWEYSATKNNRTVKLGYAKILLTEIIKAIS